MSNDEQSQHKQKHPEEESPARGIANGDVCVQSECSFIDGGVTVRPFLLFLIPTVMGMLKFSSP